MFEAALDVPADSLMNLQIKYNLQTVRNDSTFTGILSGIKRIAAAL